jgi:hypothetical protein
LVFVGLTELLDCASRGIGSDAKESVDHALGHGLALVGLRGQFAEESLDLGKVALVPVATTNTFQTHELKQARLPDLSRRQRRIRHNERYTC